MKKFVFTLQSVYNVTQGEDKQLKMQLKNLEDRINYLQGELEKLKMQYLDSKEECAREMEEGMGAEKLSQYSHFFESLTNTMILTKDNILQAEQEKEVVIQKRVVVQRKLKTLDNIRDRQWEEYQQDLKREEENEIGDLVSYRTTIAN